MTITITNMTIKKNKYDNSKKQIFLSLGASCCGHLCVLIVAMIGGSTKTISIIMMTNGKYCFPSFSVVKELQYSMVPHLP